MVALTKKKKLFIILGGVVFVGALVFLGLMLFSDKPDFAGALKYVEEILKTESTIEKTLDLENYTDASAETLSAFNKSLEKTAEYFRSLSASTALKNPEINSRYTALSPTIKKLDELNKVSKWLASILDSLDTEGYSSMLSDSQLPPPNSFAQTMLDDITNYLEKTQTFNKTYTSESSPDHDAMLDEHASLVAEGEALQQKHAQLPLKKIANISTDEIKAWFRELKALKNVLEEKSR